MLITHVPKLPDCTRWFHQRTRDRYSVLVAFLVTLLPPAIAIAIGVLVGLAKGGAISNLTNWRPTSMEVAVSGVVAMIAADLIPTNSVLVFVLELAGIGALLFATWANRRVGGMVVIALGLLMNLLPTLMSGGTPVSQDALVSSGMLSKEQLKTHELTGPRHIEEDQDVLAFLGDTISLPGKVIVSIGDLFVWVGLGLVAQSLVRRRQVRLGGSRRPSQTPRTYREALNTLGSGPAPNDQHPSEPAGTGHPNTGMVRWLPPEDSSVSATLQPPPRPEPVLPPKGVVDPLDPDAPADEPESVVRILSGPPGTSQPAIEAPTMAAGGAVEAATAVPAEPGDAEAAQADQSAHGRQRHLLPLQPRPGEEPFMLPSYARPTAQQHTQQIPAVDAAPVPEHALPLDPATPIDSGVRLIPAPASSAPKPPPPALDDTAYDGAHSTGEESFASEDDPTGEVIVPPIQP